MTVSTVVVSDIGVFVNEMAIFVSEGRLLSQTIIAHLAGLVVGVSLGAVARMWLRARIGTPPRQRTRTSARIHAALGYVVLPIAVVAYLVRREGGPSFILRHAALSVAIWGTLIAYLLCALVFLWLGQRGNVDFNLEYWSLTMPAYVVGRYPALSFMRFRVRSYAFPPLSLDWAWRGPAHGGIIEGRTADSGNAAGIAPVISIQDGRR